jgi:hypothetical protein
MQQDLFVLSLLNGKENGSYLEIGGHHPVIVNNTYLLEKLFNWKGVSVEIDTNFSNLFPEHRSNPVVNGDAMIQDYDDILTGLNLGHVIDYLSVDIEPPENTFTALKKIPHDKFRFRVITFEHCAMDGPSGEIVRDECREFLSNLGYELLINEVGNQDLQDPNLVHSVEDWWIAPELVDPEIAAKFRVNNLSPMESKFTVYNLDGYFLVNTGW